MRGFHFLLGGLALAVVSTSCSPVATPGETVHRRPERKLSKWYDDGGPGKVPIRISLTDQIAEVSRDGRDIGWCYVATGKEGHATTPGKYTITEKIEDKHSNAYGWIEDEYGNVTNGDAKPSTPVPPGQRYVAAPMPFWMRLTNYGIGMHAGIIPEPGEPASHGCIRMPKNFVPKLFAVTRVGTPVIITNEPSRVFDREPDVIPRDEWEPFDRSRQSVDAVTYHNGVPISFR
jgi:lipoprotein-anchoring transpeptidase ErfK/SrfK